MIHTSRLYRFGVDAHNPVLTNPVLIELMHNPCGGTDSSGLVGTGSINLEFSVNSVFVKPPFVEYPTVQEPVIYAQVKTPVFFPDANYR